MVNHENRPRNAGRATVEARPHSQGVVRAMAQSDPCRWVFRPRWARLASTGVSRVPRVPNGCLSARGRSGGPVAPEARGWRRPWGARTRPQRMGRTGWPRRAHTAVPLLTSSARRRPWSQRTRTRCQGGWASVRTCASGGTRPPCTHGRPVGPELRAGADASTPASLRSGAPTRTPQRAHAPPRAWTRSVGSPMLGIAPPGNPQRTHRMTWRAQGGPRLLPPPSPLPHRRCGRRDPHHRQRPRPRRPRRGETPRPHKPAPPAGRPRPWRARRQWIAGRPPRGEAAAPAPRQRFIKDTREGAARRDQGPDQQHQQASTQLPR